MGDPVGVASTLERRPAAAGESGGFWADVDHTAFRVFGAGVGCGVPLGTCVAIWRSTPMVRTTFFVVSSCVLSATPPFVAERVCYRCLEWWWRRRQREPKEYEASLQSAALAWTKSPAAHANAVSKESLLRENKDKEDNKTPTFDLMQEWFGNLWDSHDGRVLTSHGLGGLFGGAFCGALYTRRPVNGALLFFPIMISFGLLELQLQQYKQQRHLELLKEEEAEAGH